MAQEIILITGGQRSGKSTTAERITLLRSAAPVYIATAEARDDEFRERVRRHQQRRGPEWTNVERQTDLGALDVDGRQVLVDCVTMWATNYFFACDEDADRAYQELTADFDRLTSQNASFVFVTNEIGMGGISDNAMMRRFTDLLGFVNKYIAARADKVILMVAGIEVTVKK